MKASHSFGEGPNSLGYAALPALGARKPAGGRLSPTRQDATRDRTRHPRLPRRPPVAFATATEWVARLGDAQRQGRLDEELRTLLWTPLLVVDEVG
jgi:hypothetical protein